MLIYWIFSLYQYKKILKNISAKEILYFRFLFPVFFIQYVIFTLYPKTNIPPSVISELYYFRTYLQTQPILFSWGTTNGGKWTEFFNDLKINNRRISGNISEGVYDRLSSITKGKHK